MLGFPSGSILKNPPISAGDGVQTPGQEYPLENEITTYSSILAWEIHGQKSTVGYGLWDLKRIGQD